jgi:hypothetical protein
MRLHQRAVAVSTGLHGRQRLGLRGQQSIRILLQKVAFKLFNDGG